MSDTLTNTIYFVGDPSPRQFLQDIDKFREDMDRAMGIPFRELGFRMESCTPELRLIEDVTLVETFEDWSRVRSPGRARRRRGKHPQNIKITSKPSSKSYLIGDKLICHPATADAVRKCASERSERIIDELFRKLISGAT